MVRFISNANPRNCGCFLSTPLLLAFVLGCGSAQNASAEREQSSLKPLAILYGQYLGQHRGQPPKNAAEFRKFAESKSELLSQFKVANVDALLTSSRDGQPYVLIYGKPLGPAGPGAAPVIAYEQLGKEGKRWIATSVGAVAEVDQAELQRLVPNSK